MNPSLHRPHARQVTTIALLSAAWVVVAAPSAPYGVAHAGTLPTTESVRHNLRVFRRWWTPLAWRTRRDAADQRHARRTQAWARDDAYPALLALKTAVTDARRLLDKGQAEPHLLSSISRLLQRNRVLVAMAGLEVEAQAFLPLATGESAILAPGSVRRTTRPSMASSPAAAPPPVAATPGRSAPGAPGDRAKPKASRRFKAASSPPPGTLEVALTPEQAELALSRTSYAGRHKQKSCSLLVRLAAAAERGGSALPKVAEVQLLAGDGAAVVSGSTVFASRELLDAFDAGGHSPAKHAARDQPVLAAGEADAVVQAVRTPGADLSALGSSQQSWLAATIARYLYSPSTRPR